MNTHRTLISLFSLMIAVAPAACGDDETTVGAGGQGGQGGQGGTVTSSSGSQGGGGQVNTAPAPPTNFMLALQESPFGAAMSWTAPNEDDISGYVVARSSAAFMDSDKPADGQSYTPGDTLPNGAEVVFAGVAETTLDGSAPLDATTYYAVFAVDSDGLYSNGASDSITIAFPPQNGAVEVTDLGGTPTVTITQQPPNIALDGSAIFDAGSGTLTLSFTATNNADRILYSPKIAIDMISTGSATSDGTSADGRVVSYFGPGGLAVGASKSRDIVVTGVSAADTVTLDVEFLNNPMGFASSASNRGIVNFFDVSGARDNNGNALGDTAAFQLGWKVGEALHGAFTGGVFNNDGDRYFSGWKSRPVVAQIDMASLQAIVSTDLSNDGSGYGITSNVVASTDGSSLYTLVTTGAHRFTGGPNFNAMEGSDIELVQLNSETLAETGRLSLVTNALMQPAPVSRPAKGHHVSISADGSVLVAVVEPGQLWVIDPTDFKVIDADSAQAGDQPVDLSDLAAQPRIAAVNADGTVAYVGHREKGNDAAADNISVIDLTNFSRSTITSTSTPAQNAFGWSELSFGPNGNLYIARNYALTPGSIALSVFNPGTSSHIDVGSTMQILGVMFNPSGDRYHVLQRNVGGLNNNGEILTFTTNDHALVDMDNNAANGQTNLPATNVSNSAAHGHGITPF